MYRFITYFGHVYILACLTITFTLNLLLYTTEIQSLYHPTVMSPFRGGYSVPY